MPPIGGTIPAGQLAGGKLGRRRKPPRGGKPRTPTGVPKNRPPVEAAPVGGAGMPPADRPAVGRDACWRPLRHPVGDAATPPQACEVCERRVRECAREECVSVRAPAGRCRNVQVQACRTGHALHLAVFRPLHSGRRDSGGRPLSSPWDPGSGPSAYDTYTMMPQAC